MSRRTGITVAIALLFPLTLVGRVPCVRADDAACRAEMEKLCPEMKSGDGKFGKCVADHQRELSSGCTRYAKGSVARERTLRQFPSCIADAEKFCPGEKPGITSTMKCLRTHQGDLSDECKHEISKQTGK